MMSYAPRIEAELRQLVESGLHAGSAYRALLKARGILPSTSAKGNCYDHAYVESFFRTLKREMID